MYPRALLELEGYTDVKRSDIKRRPLSDTVLASIEPETREYRELDGNGLYLRVKPDGQKSWQLRYKNQQSKWSLMGLGGYPQVSGLLARKKAAELRKEIADGEDPIANRKHAQRPSSRRRPTLSRYWPASGSNFAHLPGSPAQLAGLPALSSSTFFPCSANALTPRLPPSYGWTSCRR